MDWYGDSAYRQSIKRIAPHVFCISEFYSADGLVHSKFLADAVLPHEKIENPLFIQIFWKDPEMFAKAAKIIWKEKYDITGIDVNMGCPAKKVVRSGHGSSLLINEQTAFDIVKALDKATPMPISVKTRLSFDGNQNLIKFAEGLEKAGAKLLTIHGRTAKQAYTGKADFTDIYELKQHISIPIICNGDVKNFEDGLKKIVPPVWKSAASLSLKGEGIQGWGQWQPLDGFMIGRGSFGNPWCFIGKRHVEDPEFLKISPIKKENFVDNTYHPSLMEILEAMEFHATKLVESKGEKKWSLEIRKHLVQYLKNFPWVKKYRKRLVTTESLENSLQVIAEIREEFEEFLVKRPSLGEITKENLGLE